jgi:DNA-binding PadR family transcriptional regulator
MSRVEYSDPMSLKHAALGLLTRGPASGYDLLRTFHRALANVWPATQSQLYGELGKLAEAGLVTVTEEGARRRKEYELTEAGWQELRHWLTEVEPNVSRRSDMVLRVFFLNVVGPEQADDYLRRRAESAGEFLGELAATEERELGDPGSLGVYSRLALEWGVRYAKTQREWAEWARQELIRKSG